MTYFEYAAHAINGNENYANLLKIDLEKLLKSHQVNLFLAGFSHLESLCAATEKAFGEGGHNRIFHTMGANNSLNGTTKTQIILSGTLQYFTVLVFFLIL